jgi:hypothetical protein
VLPISLVIGFTVLIIGFERLLGWERLPLSGRYGYVEMIKVFNDKVSSPLQVIYRCTRTLRLWSSLQRAEHWDLFTEVLRRSVHGWRLWRGILFPNMGNSIIYGLNLHRLRRCCILSFWYAIRRFIFWFVYFWTAVCILPMQRLGVMLKPFK